MTGSAPSAPAKLCIYPGCTRPAVGPHLLGGPQPSFCDSEDHNALTAHLKRRSLATEAGGAEPTAPPGGEKRGRR
jgi:hypothetical protein